MDLREPLEQLLVVGLVMMAAAEGHHRVGRPRSVTGHRHVDREQRIQQGGHERDLLTSRGPLEMPAPPVPTLRDSLKQIGEQIVSLHPGSGSRSLGHHPAARHPQHATGGAVTPVADKREARVTAAAEAPPESAAYRPESASSKFFEFSSSGTRDHVPA